MKQNLNILIIKNNIFYDIHDDIEKFEIWTNERTPFSCQITSIELTFSDLCYKPFGVPLNGKIGYGLDGIKERLRNMNVIKKDIYDIVIFLYNIPNGWDFNTQMLGAWTYPNPLYDQEIFIESPVQETFDSGDNLTRILTHEIIHAFHRMCALNGISTIDTMDLYDDEYNIFSKTGNRVRNLQELSQYWDVLFTKRTSRILKKISAILDSLTKILLRMKYKTMV